MIINEAPPKTSILDLSIIIVNWNSGFQLQQCINSIRRSIQGKDLPIIVIDNCSQDHSVDLIRSIKHVTIIELKENIGFSMACNLGASKVTSSFLLFLNPDTIIFKDTLIKTIKCMKSPKYSNIGICGVSLRDQNGRVSISCSNFPTSLKFILQSFGLDRIFKKYSHFMIDWPHNTTRVVDQVIGAFFMVRRSLFIQLNGFDTRFFMYFEEVDFSLRASNAGWLSIYLAKIKAFHSGGGCSNKIKGRRLFYRLRSKILFSLKNFPLIFAFFVILSTLIIEPITRILYATMTGSIREIGYTLYAYTFLFAWLASRFFLLHD